MKYELWQVCEDKLDFMSVLEFRDTYFPELTRKTISHHCKNNTGALDFFELYDRYFIVLTHRSLTYTPYNRHKGKRNRGVTYKKRKSPNSFNYPYPSDDYFDKYEEE